MSSPVLEKPSTSETSYVLLYNVSWEQLEQLDVALAGTSARLTYLDGILEIISPLSDDHEDYKKTLAMLLEVYMRAKNIRFYGRGSATIGKQEDKTRREPDESYNLGTKKSIPDLILEITVTSGGINKLEIYQRLRVPEVWFWEDGLLSVYCLQGDSYIKVSKSTLLPDLNLDILAKCALMADQYDAVTEYSQIIAKE
ncbi:Uma2 family endonuclease [Calothrix sp. FACHB-1219]|uniref:Uma2 family endonuclease n=1 Tax=unclassified Calothrix TaxID=2619626 RepID=UPI0016847B94|nr:MULTISPECIES: Uma2 family endonuclease [unclassified Calothrix]MBD2205331.1 Uma2 family endonuclease [Calothrix sp. FACHB-168]MBD2218462.1 Uma2 family endonuclease [Calothrix sp. FACHB-1219]